MIVVPNLYDRLQAWIRAIPAGRVTTYAALAEALGDIAAVRWVADWVFHAQDVTLPCHRIVLKSGQVGESPDGDSTGKASRLRAEGIQFEDRIDLRRFGWQPETDQPLVTLQHSQQSIREQTLLEAPSIEPSTVGGVDLSYVPADGTHGDRAVAAYALVEVSSGKLLWSHTTCVPVRFPYIPGYLSFRELPPLLSLAEEVQAAGKMADALLVDGNGILHQRRAGIAVHLGVLLDHPAVGVTKSLLCGTYDRDALAAGPQPVVFEGETLGMALKSTGKPLYVSPGHRTDLPFATRLVQSLLTEHRLPEPTYWADRLSRAAARALNDSPPP